MPTSWAALATPMPDGLNVAHVEGVVHLDLKLRNVMLARGGLVKVLHFGMGRNVDDPDGIKLTSTGVTSGSSRSVAPEQFQSGAVNPAADLYALDCVLYEMLLAGAAVRRHRREVQPAPGPLPRHEGTAA
ncbi:protein kinase [Streptomyces sp. NPDC048590]|uniref:protein kinase domain-containing protein n=1 Tax=Streptomyces sp. NPDC048590 TaxID=3365574 RepID=UPI0037206754